MIFPIDVVKKVGQYFLDVLCMQACLVGFHRAFVLCRIVWFFFMPQYHLSFMTRDCFFHVLICDFASCHSSSCW